MKKNNNNDKSKNYCNKCSNNCTNEQEELMQINSNLCYSSNSWLNDYVAKRNEEILRIARFSKTLVKKLREPHYAYTLTNDNRSEFYTDFCHDLVADVYAHKAKTKKASTTNWDNAKLVYFEMGSDFHHASIIADKYSDSKYLLVKQIENFNPMYDDLFSELLGLK